MDIERSHLKPWDENVGPDASVVKVGGGKKVNEDARAMLLASQVNLPLKAPYIGDTPVRVPWTVQATKVNSDAHLWRSYKMLLTDPGDSRTNGKKMYSKKMPQHTFQEIVSGGVKAKRNLCLAKEEALRQSQAQERAALHERHRKHMEAEESMYRERCKTHGVAGLSPHTLRTPTPAPAVAKDVLEAALKKGPKRGDGKRVVQDELRSIPRSPPFGPPLRAASEPMRRWEDKCVV